MHPSLCKPQVKTMHKIISLPGRKSFSSNIINYMCTPKSQSSSIKSSVAQLVRQWTSDPEMRCNMGVQALVKGPLVFGIKKRGKKT